MTNQDQVSTPEQPDDETIDRMARAAFESDKASGNVAGGSTSRHTYDNIPEDARWNYRRLVRAALAAVPPVAEQVSAPAEPEEATDALRLTAEGRAELLVREAFHVADEVIVWMRDADSYSEEDPKIANALEAIGAARAALAESPVPAEEADEFVCAKHDRPRCLECIEDDRDSVSIQRDDLRETLNRIRAAVASDPELLAASASLRSFLLAETQPGLRRVTDEMLRSLRETGTHHPASPVPAAEATPFADRPENQCPSCGTGAHAVIERSATDVVSGEGDVKCTSCGSKIRDWDAG